jgi:hypothetical protein
MANVRAALATAPPTSETECAQCFHVKPNMTGWKMQLGYRTLIDLGPASPMGTSTTRTAIPMSHILPTCSVWSYMSPIDPTLLVSTFS